MFCIMSCTCFCYCGSPAAHVQPGTALLLDLAPRPSHGEERPSGWSWPPVACWTWAQTSCRRCCHYSARPTCAAAHSHAALCATPAARCASRVPVCHALQSTRCLLPACSEAACRPARCNRWQTPPRACVQDALWTACCATHFRSSVEYQALEADCPEQLRCWLGAASVKELYKLVRAIFSCK